jgi:predicted nucleic acid-binding protein
MMAALVVLDNTVLTNFALVGRPELVLNLWGELACTTPAVENEYQVAVAAGLVSATAWADLPVVILTEAEAAFAAELPLRLGAGERTCVSVAVHRQGLFVSDDRDARSSARHHGVPITGTLGILVMGVQRGRLSRNAANALLKGMIAAGYRSPISDLNQLLSK